MSKGLEGVVAADTAIGKVYGEEGRLVYRGYEIGDLAESASFEEVCHLLWHGELPTTSGLAGLRDSLAAEAPTPAPVVDIVSRIAHGAHPMDSLRTGISALGCLDPEAGSVEPGPTLRMALRTTAQAASVSAIIQRARDGKPPVAPRPELGFAANFLYMLRGEEPDELESRILDVAFILHAEHGLNASTFAARVTVATLADVYAGVTSAIGTLRGPLHGGANEQVMRMLFEVGEPDRAEEYVRDALSGGRKIPGFGHRVYRALDPRAPILKRLSGELARRGGDTRWLEISERIQVAMHDEMERRGKRVYPNVDFFSASLYYTLRIPLDLFTNIFAVARSPGWTAHIREQLADNRLIRPAANYVGPLGKRVVPLAQRDGTALVEAPGAT